MAATTKPETIQTSAAKYQFLAGDSEMRRLIKNYDWSTTSLGPIEYWPQSLRITLGILVNSRFPMFLFWGPELVCFYNDAFRPSLGIEGKHPYALGSKGIEVWKEIWDTINPLLQQVLSGNGAVWSEDRLVPFYRNGQIEEVYWTFSYSPVLDESGAIAGVFVTCVETTKTINAFKQVEASEQQLKKLLDQVPEFIWMTGASAINVTYSNRRFLDFLGLQQEEFSGNNWEKFMHPDDLLRAQEMYNDAFSNKKPYTIESRFLEAASAQYKWILIKGVPMVGEDGSLEGYIGTGVDINDIKILHKKVEDNERQLRLVTDSLPVLISYIDKEEKYQFVNRPYKQWFNRDPKTIIGKSLLEIVGKEAYSTVKNYVERVLSGERLDFEAKMHYRDDLIKHIKTSYVPDVREGKVVGFYALVSDISEQVESRQKLEERENEAQILAYKLAVANEELVTANNEIVSRNNELAARNQQLSFINSDLDNFIYTASHDLRAPISNIEGLMNAIMRNLSSDNKQNPMVQKLSGLIAESIERFKRTLDDLTKITKIQKEGGGLDIQEINLQSIVEEVKLDVSQQIEQANAEFIIDQTGSHVIRFSAKNVRSIIYNLISNAIKYRSPHRKPVIKITYEKEAQFTVLTIEDNGLGMDLSQENKIFAMFKRLHHHVEGTGVGLYIVKKILENSGGKIEVESQVDKGSVFKVYFNNF